MAETFLVIFIFLFLVALFDDFLSALVVTVLLVGGFNLTFNIDLVVQAIDEGIREHNEAPPLDPVPDSIVVPPGENVQVVPKEFIGDQVRNPDVVHWNGKEVCGDNIPCFKPKFRQHEDGTLYACETDGLQCYKVR